MTAAAGSGWGMMKVRSDRFSAESDLRRAPPSLGAAGGLEAGCAPPAARPGPRVYCQRRTPSRRQARLKAVTETPMERAAFGSGRPRRESMTAVVRTTGFGVEVDVEFCLTGEDLRRGTMERPIEVRLDAALSILSLHFIVLYASVWLLITCAKVIKPGSGDFADAALKSVSAVFEFLLSLP